MTMDRVSKCGVIAVLWWVFCCSCSALAGDHGPPRLSKGVTENMASVPFEEGYMTLFGENNLKVSDDGKTVRLLLDKHTGSGFISQDLYLYGFFSASIKLPGDYTAGVVTAFYTSNAETFEKNHDELDFEFLGNIRGKEWRVQTNVYGNGSTSLGREERYTLWFDPTEDFHQYSILWNDKHIVFFVDDIPIRQVLKTESMGEQYPSKPMSVYTTVWDGSAWATAGGRYKVNYKYAPYEVALSNLILEGCAVDPIEQSARCTAPDSLSHTTHEDLSQDQKGGLEWFRSKHVTYSYCDDQVRYPSPLPECPPRDPSRRIRTPDVKFGSHHHQKRHRKRPRSNKVRPSDNDAAVSA